MQRLYVPSAAHRAISAIAVRAPARALAAWKSRVTAGLAARVGRSRRIGEWMPCRRSATNSVRAPGVNLAGLTPADVSVEVVYGRARENDRPRTRTAWNLRPFAPMPAIMQFAGTVTPARAGRAYIQRASRAAEFLRSAAELGLIAVVSAERSNGRSWMLAPGHVLVPTFAQRLPGRCSKNMRVRIDPRLLVVPGGAGGVYPMTATHVPVRHGPGRP
jgi:hypothetical protein